eukprot:c783_g1_i1 orf=207-542(-)
MLIKSQIHSPVFGTSSVQHWASTPLGELQDTRQSPCTWANEGTSTTCSNCRELSGRRQCTMETLLDTPFSFKPSVASLGTTCSQVWSPLPEHPAMIRKLCNLYSCLALVIC